MEVCRKAKSASHLTAPWGLHRLQSRRRMKRSCRRCLMLSHTLFCPVAPPPQMPQRLRTWQNPCLQMKRTGCILEETFCRTASVNTVAWPKQRVTHQVICLCQGHQKAWKVRAQTAPASLSCVPRAAFIWKMNISSTNSSHLCFRDHPALSFLSPPQLSLLLDQSWQQPWKEVNRSEAGLCLFHQHLLTKQKKLDCRKDVCDGLFYDWSLKKKINSPQLFINSRMVFSRRVVVQY